MDGALMGRAVTSTVSRMAAFSWGFTISAGLYEGDDWWLAGWVGLFIGFMVLMAMFEHKIEERERSLHD